MNQVAHPDPDCAECTSDLALVIADALASVHGAMPDESTNHALMLVNLHADHGDAHVRLRSPMVIDLTWLHAQHLKHRDRQGRLNSAMVEGERRMS